MSRTYDPNSLSVLLDAMESGQIKTEACQKLAEVFTAVRETGGKGSLTIKIDIQAGKKNRLVVVKGDVTHKMPKVGHDETFLFVTDGMSVVKDDPDQSVLVFEHFSG